MDNPTLGNAGAATAFVLTEQLSKKSSSKSDGSVMTVVFGLLAFGAVLVVVKAVLPKEEPEAKKHIRTSKSGELSKHGW